MVPDTIDPLSRLAIRFGSERPRHQQAVPGDPKALVLPPRVTTVKGSPTDTVLLRRVLDEHGPFDIVIDDGSHIVPDVLTTFLFLYPRLPDGAIYVVEDSQTSFIPVPGGNPARQDTTSAGARDCPVHAQSRRASVGIAGCDAPRRSAFIAT